MDPMDHTASVGLTEPPEGALVGESVPVENDEEEIAEGLIEECIGLLKTRPGYAKLSDEELREKAIERLTE